MSINLQDFFRYYKPDNPKHRAAVDELATAMPPTLLSDQANWVRIYRTPVASVQKERSQTLSASHSGLPQPGVDLLKQFEGCKLAAYVDPGTGGKPITIGWGSTRRQDGSEWYLGDRITQQQADYLLEWQLLRDYLPPCTKIPAWDEFNDNQKGALLSFAYNLGVNFYGAKNFETITRVLRERSYGEIRKALLLYRNPGSNVEAGLKRRRIAEADLWEKGSAATESSLIRVVTREVFKEVPADLTPAAVPWNDMSFHLTENFTVGENLRNDSRRIPQDATVQANILKIMREVQKIRNDYGKPIAITSGHRPTAINRANNGARDSRHIAGDAVDIKPVEGNVNAFQAWLDKSWYGALGYGAPKGFVHLDCRNGRGWKTGGTKGVRWVY